MARTPERELAPTEPGEEFQPNPVMHLVAPVIAIAATMVVRKALSVGYEQMTGKKPPAPRDPAVAFSRAIAWAVVSAAAAAAVETAVYRIANQAGGRAARR
jgi:Protein of unknown function (DUF4235)